MTKNETSTEGHFYEFMVAVIDGFAAPVSAGQL